MTAGIQMVSDRIKQLRLERAWSQEQLAEISGVSSRTIQRIEQGDASSLETLKALAAAFGLTPDALTLSSPSEPKLEEGPMTQSMAETNNPTTQSAAGSQARRMQRFYRRLFIYAAVSVLLSVVYFLGDYRHPWIIYPLLGMLIALAASWPKFWPAEER